MFTLQTRPIDQWPGELTRSRKRAPFGNAYGSTMALLERELRMVRAKAPVLLMALSDDQIRLDGRPYANAKPAHPGVILCFDSKRGPQRFPCDTFTTWSDNLRAIALSLEALRKVDRCGVSQRGEQYEGWAALPPPRTEASAIAEARTFIEQVIGNRVEWREPHQSNAIRRAEMKTHPDAGGNAADFKRVQDARRLLLP